MSDQIPWHSFSGSWVTAQERSAHAKDAAHMFVSAMCHLGSEPNFMSLGHKNTYASLASARS